jgi:hypothetical protein
MNSVTEGFGSMIILPRPALALFLPVLFLGAAGCGKSTLPKTYPVAGSVVYQGGQPMKGGFIQFNSDADPLLRVMGDIKPDGTFALRTVKENEQAAGAPRGEYQVVVTPPRPAYAPGDVAAAQKSVPPITLPRAYQIDRQETALKIELPEAPPNP